MEIEKEMENDSKNNKDLKKKELIEKMQSILAVIIVLSGLAIEVVLVIGVAKVSGLIAILSGLGLLICDCLGIGCVLNEIRWDLE